jgi:hypothetical protein
MPGPRQSSTKDGDRRYALLALRIMGEFGVIIAVPAVLLTLGGKWLDGRYGTRPLFQIAGLLFAVALTGVAVVRKARAFEKEYQDIAMSQKKDTPPPPA